MYAVCTNTAWGQVRNTDPGLADFGCTEICSSHKISVLKPPGLDHILSCLSLYGIRPVQSVHVFCHHTTQTTTVWTIKAR
jgi:hypothetical protein